MDDEPDWAKVLRAMHEEKKTQEHLTIDDATRQVQFLSDYTDLPDHGVKATLDYLQTVELIQNVGEQDGDDGPFILTSKGFDVAHTQKLKEERFGHERELSKRQNQTNTALVVFTLGLVLASLVTVLPSKWSFLVYTIPLRLLGAIGVVVVVAAILWQTDLYEVLLP